MTLPLRSTRSLFTAAALLVAGAARICAQEPAAFTPRAGEIVTITDEALRLKKSAPAGWNRGTPLPGTQAAGPGKAPAPGCYVPGSLALSQGETRFVLGRDFLVDEAWGTTGLTDDTRIDPAQPVTAAYRVALRRLDALIETADGRRAVREGVSALTDPTPPVLRTGERLLGCYFVDYRAAAGAAEFFRHELPWPNIATASTPGRIQRTLAKLQSGAPLTIVFWGDSVTVGGDASREKNRFADRVVAALRAQFPRSPFTPSVVAVGGSTSAQWLKPDAPATEPRRWQRVADAAPDLVIVEFVNDSSLPSASHAARYDDLAARLRALGAEVIFVAPHFTYPERMGFGQNLRAPDGRDYVSFLRLFADRHRYALADVSGLWGQFHRTGAPYLVLLKNGINHPNDQGHAMMAAEILKCFSLPTLPSH